MKHLIFTDIDGTIYPHSKKIHSQTFKDIAFAQSKGVEVILCTGNGHFDNVESLAEKLNIRYCVTSNGASIKDRTQNEFLFKSMIEAKKANELLQYANQHKIGADFWDEKGIYYNEYCAPRVFKLIKNCMSEQGELKPRKEITNDIFKIEFYDEPKQIDFLTEFLKENQYTYARMKPQHVEVTGKGASKGLGLKWLAQHLNSSEELSMAVGDSANDIPMFKVAKHAYAMANASKEAKDEAHHHTAAVEQNGLGMAIIDFMYREKLDK